LTLLHRGAMVWVEREGAVLLLAELVGIEAAGDPWGSGGAHGAKEGGYRAGFLEPHNKQS